MENNETTVTAVAESTEESTNTHPVLKLVFGTAAALVAGWAVEHGIDAFAARRSNKKTELTVVPDEPTE